MNIGAIKSMAPHRFRPYPYAAGRGHSDCPDKLRVATVFCNRAELALKASPLSGGPHSGFANSDYIRVG
jgi:hypothetical protein